MGVPCITLEGQCHAHNVGVSLLTALGMVDGWVARSEEEYIELAVGWCGLVWERVNHPGSGLGCGGQGS